MQTATNSHQAAQSQSSEINDSRLKTNANLSSDQLSRFEADLSDEDIDNRSTWLFARSVQDQIHDQYRQF